MIGEVDTRRRPTVACNSRSRSHPSSPRTEDRAMTEYARRSIVDRMKGAALLDVATYEEVEHDTEATGQAAVVVRDRGDLRGDWRDLARWAVDHRRADRRDARRGCCGRRSPT